MNSPSFARLPILDENWPLELAVSHYASHHHGDFEKWKMAISQLPTFALDQAIYDDTVTFRGAVDLAQVRTCMQSLHPWRKGPFNIAGVHIDTEWRSDWKWSRIATHLDLQHHRVLDIGCGNGYFGWRMLQSGAREVIGIDPTLLFCMQHQAIQHFAQDFRNWVIPLGIEHIPISQQFDSVFSMGVLYHRRDPMEHIKKLYDLTLSGGQCILESLIVDGNDNLIPPARYARMRNVWCVPTVQQMVNWMQSTGFKNVDVLDVSTTTTDEQRSTEWMTFESLKNSLAGDERTIEGHPAPRRAVIRGFR